jgi:CMP-N,N'-diacetyllegionaminic acid synthase
MIDGQRVLAVIPARGGSKRIPRKNIRNLAGKPLIAWTIDEALKSRYIDQMIVSSEDEEIMQVAHAWGCDIPFVRPHELAGDDTPGTAPVLHALQMLPGYAYVVLLQPTSPLRIAQDIDDCMERLAEHQANACVSVAETDKSPYWLHTLDDAHHLYPIQIHTEKQSSASKFYIINGAVYAAKVDWLMDKQSFLSKDTVAFVMPSERSVDVDTEYDFRLCDYYLRNIRNR